MPPSPPTPSSLPSSSLPLPSVLKIATFNVVSARRTRLNQAIRAMSLMSLDLVVLTETKLTRGLHATSFLNYSVAATDAASAHQGGVALVYRANSDHFWHLESIRSFGPNVISALLVSGTHRWNLVGCYIPPSDRDGTTLSQIHSAAQRFSHPLLLLGDLNVDLDNPHSPRDLAISASLATLGIFDFSTSFYRRVHRWTWCQRRDGVVIHSLCDYILGTSRTDWRNIQYKTVPYYDSDHRLVRGDLLLPSAHCHHHYVKLRKRYPFRLPSRSTRLCDKKLSFLRKHRDRPSPAQFRSDSWIAPDTWVLIDRRAHAKRFRNTSSAQLRLLSCSIRRHIRHDRRVRTNTIGRHIELCLASNDSKGAYRHLKGWYRKRSGRPFKPTHEDLTTVAATFRHLYSRVPIAGNLFPVRVTPYHVPDGPPLDAEITDALYAMNLNRSPGPTGIRTEDLRRWHLAREDDPAPWTTVVQIIQQMFLHGTMPRTLGDNILVLLPKNDGSNHHRGIGLLETLWKLTTTIINRRLLSSIRFHDDLHGFCPHRGTGTAILETKLTMQLHQRTSAPYYFVFLDLSKAYDALDRQRTLQILTAYGVGPATRRLLNRFWSTQRVVPRQAGFLGDPFHATRGVTQGDVISPSIFNIVVDAIIREWHHQMDHGSIGPPITKAIFYADDGNLHGPDPAHLQLGLDRIASLFALVGLNLNPNKTKAMIMDGGAPYHRISDEAYHYRMTGDGQSYTERQHLPTECPECGHFVRSSYLSTHRLHQHGIALSQSRLEGIYDPDPEPDLHIVSMPTRKFDIDCPVPGCPGHATDRFSLRRHFMHRHILDTLIIIEEGILPRCDQCGMFITTDSPSELTRHQNTKICRSGAKQYAAHHQEILQCSARHVRFIVDGRELENVPSFRYLGRMLCNDDNDWLAVSTNIKKARARWGMVSRILARDGSNTKMMGLFYKTIVQSVLLYGSETWVLTRKMLTALESFHHHCARAITRRFIHQNADGTWTHPNTSETLQAASLFPITEYIRRRRETILPYANSRWIYRQCQQSNPLASNANQLVWWRPTINGPMIVAP